MIAASFIFFTPFLFLLIRNKTLRTSDHRTHRDRCI